MHACMHAIIIVMAWLDSLTLIDSCVFASTGLPGPRILHDEQTDRQERRVQLWSGTVGAHHRHVAHRVWQEYRPRGTDHRLSL